jgi:hypothetical protein
MIAPVVGGAVIALYGVVRGMRGLFAAAVLMAAIALQVVRRIDLPAVTGEPANIRGVWSSFPSSLRWLLVSDVFIRTCEGMVDVFLVIYATSVLKLSAPQFGVLIAIQTVTSILVYLPAAKVADRIGRKPFVVATFLMFALFPLAVTLASSFAAWAFRDQRAAGDRRTVAQGLIVISPPRPAGPTWASTTWCAM